MFDELSDITLIETPLMDSAGFLELLLRFCFNLLVVSCIIHLFYYPKSKRRDYYFTFTLISISIFLMIFLLGSVKLKIGLRSVYLPFSVSFAIGPSQCPCVR